MFATSYAAYYDLFHQDKPYKQEIEFVYQWAGKPKTVLDLGCGTASYWKHYPKDTMLVGVERSMAMADPTKRIIYADITDYRTDDRFDCVTALFDVLNYIPNHDWWHRIPVRHGGYFIFDIWDKRKVDKEGFRTTRKKVENLIRTITPSSRHPLRSVDLKIQIQKVDFDHNTLTETFSKEICNEIHKMYLHSQEDILFACKNSFDVVEIKPTRRWQTWWKLRRK